MIEVLKQALEHGSFPQGSGIIHDLKKAIAELESQEPVAWRTFDGEGGYDYRSYEDNESYADDWNKRNPKHVGWVDELYTHSPQPEQEPVAWMDADGNTFPFVWNVGVQQGSKYLDETLTPLYTYPPQRTEQEPVADDFFKMIADKNPKPFPPPQRTWVGLAAEDRLTAKYMQDAPDGIEAVIDYIETKLKEKNNA
jgi:hypothetical protein